MDQEQLNNFRKKIEDARNDLVKCCEQAFHEGIKPIFEKYPELRSFGWRQYTQYWNDGDATEFSVRDYPDSININEVEGYDVVDELKNDWAELAQGDISKLLAILDRDFFLSTWGDHSAITVHRDGTIENKDYSNHD